jgi:hypothetical protein
MGADIHMYIQYKEKERTNTNSLSDWWDGFGGQFGSRNYTLFGILAGVRERTKHSFDPKGIPTFGLSYDVARDLYLYILKIF